MRIAKLEKEIRNIEKQKIIHNAFFILVVVLTYESLMLTFKIQPGEEKKVIVILLRAFEN